MKNNKKVQLKILKKGLTYEQARTALLETGAMITRPDWKGYHFRYFENYGIRLANGDIVLNPKEILDTDKKDWMIVDTNDKNEIEMVYIKIERLLKNLNNIKE